MYRHHYSKAEAFLQSVDINTLKKPSTAPACKQEENTLSFLTHPNSVLLLMGTYALAQEMVETSDVEFSQFPFDSIPRQFQQFSHEKTISQLFNILRKQVKSVEIAVEMLNSYPIFVHVLQCWVRRRAMVWIEANPSLEYMGNEQEILIDLNQQIRGPLLGVIATSLKIYLKLKFIIQSNADPSINEEELGDPGTKWELQVELKSDCTASGTLLERDSEITSLSNIPSKTSECGYLRRSKMGETEPQIRSGGEYKSVKKERPAYCEKCGYGKRCECNQIKRKGFGLGYGMTPKNNQLSSSSNGVKGEPFSIGFLNEHNISKIRDSNTAQK